MKDQHEDGPMTKDWRSQGCESLVFFLHDSDSMVRKFRTQDSDSGTKKLGL